MPPNGLIKCRVCHRTEFDVTITGMLIILSCAHCFNERRLLVTVDMTGDAEITEPV